MALLIAGCAESVVSANGIPNRTFSVAVGQELALTLQTIGPGEYASPPAVSATQLVFLGVFPAGYTVPAGQTQRFRFKAQGRGLVVIRFQHTVQDGTIEDTVIVH